MLTRMTSDDWETVTQVFWAVRPRQIEVCVPKQL